jgi:predicted nucleotidyltransferase
VEARRRHRVSPAFLQEAKRRLKAALGARLRGVILFGSEARGEAWNDSDIDLLLLLERPVRTLADIETAVDAIYAL